MAQDTLPHVSATDDPEKITQTLREAGCLIIDGLLSRARVKELTTSSTNH